MNWKLLICWVKGHIWTYTYIIEWVDKPPTHVGDDMWCRRCYLERSFNHEIS